MHIPQNIQSDVWTLVLKCGLCYLYEVNDRLLGRETNDCVDILTHSDNNYNLPENHADY
jgi:hypothetical protein